MPKAVHSLEGVVFVPLSFQTDDDLHNQWGERPSDVPVQLAVDDLAIAWSLTSLLGSHPEPLNYSTQNWLRLWIKIQDCPKDDFLTVDK